MNSLRIFSLIAFIAFSVPANAGKNVPTYNGRPLAYWMERLQTAPSDDARREAANAVVAFGADADPAVPKLVELLDDRSPEYRGVIAHIVFGGIAKDAKSVVPAMIKLLAEKKGDPKLVINVLQYAGPKAKEAVPHLRQALKHDRAEVRYAAAAALWSTAKNTDGVPVVVALIKEKGSERKEFFYPAVELLGEIGADAKSALPALRASLVRARDVGLERQVEDAIEKIENKKEK